MYDVIIAGAGPSGLIAANLCGLYGMKTLLIERNAGISEIPKAILVDDETLRVIDRIGLYPEMRQVITPGGGADYFSNKMKPFASVRPTEMSFGYPKRNKIVQPIFEKVLLEGVKRFSNVEIRYTTELISFDQNDDYVKVKLRDDDGEKTLESLYLLGCDGGRSTVRKQLGIKLEEVGSKKNGSSFEEPWVIVDLKNDDVNTRHTSFFCDPPRPAMHAYTAFGQRRYEFMLLDGEDPEEMLSDEKLAELIAPYTEYKPENLVKKAVVVFNALVAEKFGEGRVVLVGDSAHLTPPFAGQGLNSGVRDAFNIVWKIKLAAEGKAAPSIVESYEKERKEHVEAMIRLSVRMGNFILTTSKKRKLVRDAAFGAMKIVPPLKRYVTEMRFKPKPICSKGLFIDIEKPLVGEMFRQSTYMNCDSEMVPIDRYMKSGFNLLKIGAPDEIAFPAMDSPVWQAINPTKISIYPEHFVTREMEDSIPLTDVNNDLNLYLNKFVLIRPDFYVMGVFSAEEFESFTNQLEDILEPKIQLEESYRVAL
ncbi:FAD-dependent monooxygenase [Bhargavaea ginsengi]|uniref:FAD-dependent monooxygenase n=1 Tax=Bhargavaea ginsengi TaxID=426757 RepID=UPI003C76515E